MNNDAGIGIYIQPQIIKHFIITLSSVVIQNADIPATEQTLVAQAPYATGVQSRSANGHSLLLIVRRAAPGDHQAGRLSWTCWWSICDTSGELARTNAYRALMHSGSEITLRRAILPLTLLTLSLQSSIMINSFDQIVTKTNPRLRRFNCWLLYLNE